MRGHCPFMNNAFSRRSLLRSGAIGAAAFTVSNAMPAWSQPSPAGGKPSPIKLGLASYTFRNFSRAQLIGFMKQLDVLALNAKDVKDHLPMDPAGGSTGARGLCGGQYQASCCWHCLLP